jgi:hypothetical protein
VPPPLDVQAAAARISAVHRRHGVPPRVEAEIFGEPEPAAIVRAVDGFCRAYLGAGAERFELYAASVASVHGLRLTDGRRVVVKAHRPDADRDHLAAVQRIQAVLSQAGFPCPRPLAGPAPLGRGVGLAETLLDDGEPADARVPAVRRALAAALARLVRLGRPLVAAGLAPGTLFVPSPGSLWPVPHDRRFDFEGTRRGAEWIERLAAEALRVRDAAPGEPVLGHLDWRAEHVRLREGRVSAVYDWESATVAPEPLVAGQAACAFTADWSVERRVQLPALEESLAFVADYEAARGAAFSAGERRGVIAALLYTKAYTARCEHSDALTAFGTLPTGPVPGAVPEGGARAFLARHGAQLLGVEPAGDEPAVEG